MPKPRWKNPDKRMARAAELRAQGWSLRRIGTELAVDAATIHRDLARWERERKPEDSRPALRLVASPLHPIVASDPDATPQCNAYAAKEEGA